MSRRWWTDLRSFWSRSGFHSPWALTDPLRKSKINSLQTSHTDLQTILLNAQNTEREARKDLSSASEELFVMRAAHAREVDDLERQIQRKDREKRGLEEELGDSRDELGREREVVRELKVRVD